MSTVYAARCGCGWRGRRGCAHDWGCGRVIKANGRVLVNGCPRTGHVLFHPKCWPDVATVPAFSTLLAAEMASTNNNQVNGPGTTPTRSTSAQEAPA